MEIEEALSATGLVAESIAFGVEHPMLGQASVVSAMAKVVDRTTDASPPVDVASIKRACQRALPAWMQPAVIELRDGPLPRNPNGKIDRKSLSSAFVNPFVLEAEAR